MTPPGPADDALADVMATADEAIAYWRAQGDVTPNHVWLELTGERRRYATWSEVKGFVMRWELRRISREPPVRRAA